MKMHNGGKTLTFIIFLCLAVIGEKPNSASIAYPAPPLGGRQQAELSGNHPQNRSQFLQAQARCLRAYDPDDTLVNVRSGPSPDSSPVRAVGNGTRLVPTGNESNGWYEIRGPVPGWVAGNLTTSCSS